MKNKAAIPAKAGILWILAGFFLLALSGQSAYAEGVTVLELYTAQGCPSCPPADRLMLDLAKQPGIIALGCHVTYFDSSGRKDPLAIKPCDARQSAYRRAGVTDKLFTPMAVINGSEFAMGNQESAVRQKMREEGKIPEIVLREQDNHLNIDLPSLALKKPVTLWVFAYDDLHPGRRVNYANAVRHVSKLMSWDGRPVKMALPLDGIDVGGYVVLAQYTDNSTIVAAGKTD